MYAKTEGINFIFLFEFVWLWFCVMGRLDWANPEIQFNIQCNICYSLIPSRQMVSTQWQNIFNGLYTHTQLKLIVWSWWSDYYLYLVACTHTIIIIIIITRDFNQRATASNDRHKFENIRRCNQFVLPSDWKIKSEIMFAAAKTNSIHINNHRADYIETAFVSKFNQT